jgi:hypothetical protein
MTTIIKRPTPTFIKVEVPGTNSDDSFRAVPLATLSHLYGLAERRAQAAGTDNNTQAVYQFFGTLLAEELKTPPDWFNQDMLLLLVREMTVEIAELKKNYCALED